MFRLFNMEKDLSWTRGWYFTICVIQVYDYLVESAACNQTRESIDNFLEKSEEFQLAKAEVINIINIRPASAVEVAPVWSVNWLTHNSWFA